MWFENIQRITECIAWGQVAAAAAAYQPWSLLYGNMRVLVVTCISENLIVTVPTLV